MNNTKLGFFKSLSEFFVRISSIFFVAICVTVFAGGLTSISKAQTAPSNFQVTQVAGNLGRGTVGFTHLPDGRILVIHHQSGKIELLVDGERSPNPVMEIDNLVTSSEQGLLGIAVDPDYPDENYIYLFHTQSDNTNQVSRFTVSGDLTNPQSFNLSMDLSSKTKILSLPDLTRFHNGGTLRFGKDKTLYISSGDDAYANEVQSLTNYFGKILRINRDGTIPSDNPEFPNAPADRLKEVYVMGLRNPFRFSIDPQTGNLFIGDVGTNLAEELNIASGGENFGYPHYEGEGFFRDFVPLVPPAPTFPAHHYSKSSSRSAIALATYRPIGNPGESNFPLQYDGAHFYVDFFENQLKYLLQGFEGYESHVFGSGYSQLVDGALGPDGSLYLLSYNGSLLKIAYDNEDVVSVENPENEVAFKLMPAYPNPFSQTTTVQYHLSQAQQVNMEVFDLLGRKVATLVANEVKPAGAHQAVFDPEELPEGVYWLRMSGEGVQQSQSLVLRR